MSRNPEYQQFLDTVNGHMDGLYNPHELTIATLKEIGWWKQYQIRRAIGHLHYGKATPPELHLLEKHGVIHMTPEARRTNRKSTY